MVDLEPTPLEDTPLEESLTTGLDAGGGDFDMPVDDFFDLDPFPLDGMPLEGEDWLSTQSLPDEGSATPGATVKLDPTGGGSSSNAGGGATTRPGAALPPPPAGVSPGGGGGAAVGVTAPIPTSVGPPTVAVVPQQQQQMQSALAQQQLSQAQPQQLPLLQQQQGLPEIENILQQQSVGLDVKLVNGNGLPDAAGPPVMLSPPQPQTVVDKLAAMVAEGGPAATNLGRLANGVSSSLGFRAPGSVTRADSPRPYLAGGVDADLRAVESGLGFTDVLGVEDTSAGVTPAGLRNVGQTLGRQANNAFEAMAAAADTSQGDPAALSDVISHQLGPLPRLLNGFASGCAALTPPVSHASVGNGAASSAGSLTSLPSAGGDNNSNAPSNSALKRPKSECSDDNERLGKVPRMESGGIGGGSGPATSAFAGGGDPADNGSAGAGAGSMSRPENGGGASSSPAAAAPPASNLLARPTTADFRHGGGEEMMALLKAKVGRIFSLEAEYTHVRSNNGPVPAALGVNGTETLAVAAAGSGGEQDGGGDVGTAVSTGGDKSGSAAGDNVGTNGLRRVLARLKAVRAGQFVAYIQFDVAGNEFRPCDVSVLSWGEAGEGSSAAASSAVVKSEGGGGQGSASDGSSSPREFMNALDGTKPWRTSQHTALIHVSGHAYQALHTFVNKRADGNVGEALVSFLQWMCAYDCLFRDPCKIANKLVATDAGTGEPLPPTLRSPNGDALFPQSLAGVPQRPGAAGQSSPMSTSSQPGLAS